MSTAGILLPSCNLVCILILLQVVGGLQEALRPPAALGGKHVVRWANQPELLQVR